MSRLSSARSVWRARLAVLGAVCAVVLAVAAPAWAAPSVSSGYDETGQFGLLGASSGGGGSSKPPTGKASAVNGSPGANTKSTKVATGTLPFTGLDVVWLLVGAVILLAGGTALRRFGSPRHPAD